jgi:TonB family protein
MNAPTLTGCIGVFSPDRTMSRLKGIASTCAILLAMACLTGAASQQESTLGPVKFDARGADFTSWLNQFKTEMYQRWMLPSSLAEDRSFQVRVRLVIEREGTVKSIRVLKRSGDDRFDAAAQAAVRGATLLPLPEDYPAQRLTLELPFSHVARQKK